MNHQSIKKIPIHKAKTALEALLNEDFYVPHACEGMGACATCRVTVLEGAEKLPPMDFPESDRAQERNFKENERLACQIPALEGVKIVLLHTQQVAEFIAK